MVSTAFVRLMTNRRMLAHPVVPTQAVDWVRGWFDFPHIVPINLGAEHLTHMRRLLEAVGVGGNLVMDAHLAAMAIENQAELQSNESDFARFSRLRWRDPL